MFLPYDFKETSLDMFFLLFHRAFSYHRRTLMMFSHSSTTNFHHQNFLIFVNVKDTHRRTMLVVVHVVICTVIDLCMSLSILNKITLIETSLPYFSKSAFAYAGLTFRLDSFLRLLMHRKKKRKNSKSQKRNMVSHSSVE